MIGDKIKWRIKIINLKCDIMLGIGLKKILTINEFYLDLNYNKHGCYIVSSDGYSLTYMNK